MRQQRQLEVVCPWTQKLAQHALEEYHVHRIPRASPTTPTLGKAGGCNFLREGDVLLFCLRLRCMFERKRSQSHLFRVEPIRARDVLEGVRRKAAAATVVVVLTGAVEELLLRQQNHLPGPVVFRVESHVVFGVHVWCLVSCLTRYVGSCAFCLPRWVLAAT